MGIVQTCVDWTMANPSVSSCLESPCHGEVMVKSEQSLPFPGYRGLNERQKETKKKSPETNSPKKPLRCVSTMGIALTLQRLQIIAFLVKFLFNR